ncbi:Nif11 family protein [Oceanibaculum pacificum]|uniref:Uncharacterized protein n=1 Tax=Oceanibaculum pacificum TaxID=580166 RepID=A0A154W308_9PROT|nr:Nif11 family protein [Oceanibaculum pacificum]KZD07920.1 hypothetical protein AUP43_09405 [Oceanibaculum pacificum]
MSLEEFGGFVQTLQQDEALKQRFQAMIGSLPEGTDAAPHVIAFAKAEGHAIGSADIDAFNTLLLQAKNGELDDTTLDTVNGGIFGLGLNLGLGALSLPGAVYGSISNTQNGFDPSKREFWLGF